jgi:hypothetical protein
MAGEHESACRRAHFVGLDWGSLPAARNKNIRFAHHEPLPRVSFSNPLLLVVVGCRRDRPTDELAAVWEIYNSAADATQTDLSSALASN